MRMKRTKRKRKRTKTPLKDLKEEIKSYLMRPGIDIDLDRIKLSFESEPDENIILDICERCEHVSMNDKVQWCMSWAKSCADVFECKGYENLGRGMSS